MCQVKITPWDRDNTVDIDEVYTTLSWTRNVKTPSGTVKSELDDYTEIFKGHGRIKNPKRMLVYGRPGIGKSTFSQKLAVDWANGCKENLKVFDLFLLIRLRDVEGTQDLPAIMNASKLLATDGSTSTDSLYEYVLHNQEKVLLVLDGFDEFSGGISSTIHDIWSGRQLRDCHVIMTTREMEGEWLIRFSHLQFEIIGFLSKEQVVSFASRFITDRKEIEEFYYYLVKRKLLDLSEIPLLLLMLCLIWRNRDCKELPMSKLGLHERFVETLLYHLDVNDSDSGPEKKVKEEETVNDKQSEIVLVKYKAELAVIGRMALEALLLRSAPYIDLNEVNVESGGLTDKMIRSGLFQFSKLTVAEPAKRMFFPHKSIQEYVAAWYIMNEAALEEGKSVYFAGMDSFDKASRLFYILRFMCEWSKKGATAVFTLLEFLGRKENLSKCSLAKTPSIFSLSEPQRRFRDICLGCLLSCLTSFRQDFFPSFISCVDGVLTVNDSNRQIIAAEHLPRSDICPRYVFFHGWNLPDSVLADLNAFVVKPNSLWFEASDFVRRYMNSPLQAEHFFLINEGGQFFLYFATINRKEPGRYHELLRELTTPSNQPFSVRNCFSLVGNILFSFQRKEELRVLSYFLPFVISPRKVKILNPVTGKDFSDPELEKLVISKINMTDNLCSLNLTGLDVTTEDVARLNLPPGCEVIF